MKSSRKETQINGKKPTIADLEHMLNHEEDVAFAILPNGQIVEAEGKNADLKPLKPLTFRENMGGEYALTAKLSTT